MRNFLSISLALAFSIPAAALACGPISERPVAAPPPAKPAPVVKAPELKLARVETVSNGNGLRSFAVTDAPTTNSMHVKWEDLMPGIYGSPQIARAGMFE